MIRLKWKMQYGFVFSWFSSWELRPAVLTRELKFRRFWLSGLMHGQAIQPIGICEVRTDLRFDGSLNPGDKVPHNDCWVTRSSVWLEGWFQSNAPSGWTVGLTTIDSKSFKHILYGALVESFVSRLISQGVRWWWIWCEWKKESGWQFELVQGVHLMAFGQVEWLSRLMMRWVSLSLFRRLIPSWMNEYIQMDLDSRSQLQLLGWWEKVDGTWTMCWSWSRWYIVSW